MTDYQILTIIAAFIIVDVAVLSLVAIPLLRRRLAARMDKAASAEAPPIPALSADPLGTASAGRLAAAIGTRPTLSAPVPTAGDSSSGADDIDVRSAASGAEIDASQLPDTVAPDVIEAIAAARAAADAGEHPTSVTTGFDDAQDEAQTMDSTEMSVARARGFAIHPVDPLMASTIDRLLGARPQGDEAATPAPTATAEATAEGTAPGDETASSEAIAADPSATTAANGTSGFNVSGDLPVTSEAGAPSEPGDTGTAAAAGRGLESGRPVMATGIYTGDGALEPSIDLETGLDSPLTWAMEITIEEARSGRYGRPVSIVIAELDGLDRLAELFGAEVADKLIPPVADALRRSARAADRVARLSHARFGVLLVETDEVRAINYVERVRSACDGWLEASAIALRLSIGWASPATDGDLRSAVRIAEERMHREQRRPAPWRPAMTTSSGTTSTGD